MFNTQGAEGFNNVSDTLRKYGVNDSSYYRWKPTENGQIESFNWTMLNEILRGVEFESVREVREELEKWREKYNNERPHSALKYEPPISRSNPYGGDTKENKLKSINLINNNINQVNLLP